MEHYVELMASISRISQIVDIITNQIPLSALKSIQKFSRRLCNQIEMVGFITDVEFGPRRVCN